MSFALTDSALRATGITTGQTVVLAAIATFADQNGRAWPSLQAIQKITKQSIRTIQYRIAELVKMGFLQRIFRQGRSAISIITERITGVLATGQTHANRAPTPMQTVHPEPAIESINTKTAPSQIDSIAAGTDIVVFEIPAIPDTKQPQAIAPVLTELPVHSEPVQTTVNPPLPNGDATVNPFADVPVQLIEDFGQVRRAKKKPAKITNTEAVIFADEVGKAGISLTEAVRICVLRGWSRFEASWLPVKVPEQATRVYKPETVKLASPEVKAAGLAALAELRRKMTGKSTATG